MCSKCNKTQYLLKNNYIYLEKQNNSSFHFQGYLEFSWPIDALAFQKKWSLTDIQSRIGKQSQAIDL